ncbi:Lipid A core-O-antigen ligase and related enzymes [Paenibacillus uliginis N3/975]|uniref:Lipid A core-O-antigen ligase and related enzymes n=1 Tax=Paenibacillus uliginis N3/975 TaxID=1313296 RepID=A0A1X7GKB0_9BACL|nr:O-antigen ligase family protein [Paenibacillus uliginis]SMF70976.1 Lipid A core-O-antigen ligase and related enzymes [Paenibacillus uliginis N3/975]
MLILVMGMSSLKAGLFFDEDLHGVSIMWGISCMLLTAGYVLTGNKPRFLKQHKTPLFPLLVCVGGIVIIYIWHGMNGSISAEGTGNEIIRWGLFGSVGTALWMASREQEGGRMLRLVWHMTGLILCGSALLAVYGLVDLPHAFFRSVNLEVSATGARLGGLLQYPNTFGAVMAAFLLERLFALPAALRGRASPLRAAAALLPLAPYTAALLLTESRGAWLAAALACAAGLAAERRWAAPLLAASAAPVAGAALLYRQLADVQLAPAVLPGLLWLAGLWAGSVLAGLLLWRGLRSSSRPAPVSAPDTIAGRPHDKALNLPSVIIQGTAPDQVLVPADRLSTDTAQGTVSDTTASTSLGNGCGAASGIISVPASVTGYRQLVVIIMSSVLYAIAFATVLSRVKARLVGGAETMSARQLMYQDAWGLFSSAPWLGRGGDTWRLSYRSIQSQPYVGAEVHSGYIDLLLNTGVIGSLMVFILLLMSAIRLRTTCPPLVPSLSVLMIHSIIDFDWSFGLVWLLILWLAAMGAGQTSREASQAAVLKRTTEVSRTSRFRLIFFIRKFRWHHVLFITGMVCLTAWTALASSYWMGNRYYEQALYTANREERKQLLKTSIRWNPVSPEAAALLAELLPAKEAADLLNRSLARSPGHPALTWQMAELHAMSGNSRQAAVWYKISIDRDRHHTVKQTRAILSLAQMARNQWASGKNRAAIHTTYSALEIYDLYRQSVEVMARNPLVRNDRDFRMTIQAEQEGRKLKQRIAESNLRINANAMDIPVLLTPNTR